MYMNGLCVMYICVPCTCSAHKGQKEASCPLELQVVVNHHVDTGDSVFLEKSSQCCYHLNHLSRPKRLFLQQTQQYYFWKPDFCFLVSLIILPA